MGAMLAPISIQAQWFKSQLPPQTIKMAGFKGSDLCTVAENTHRYLKKNPTDAYAVHIGNQVIKQRFSLKDIDATLLQLCQIYREDVRANRQSRLHNVDFLTNNFDFYRWYPDKKSADGIAKKSTNALKTRLLTGIPTDQLFLTKYYTKLLDASPIKTEQFDQALYQLPVDEQGLTLVEADKLKSSLTRYKYTRQQVIAGALNQSDDQKSLAQPLVWITEEALHDVLLQGTGVLNVDGKIRYFNVHRNNGIAYDYHIGKRDQARYWYFAEVPSIMGYGTEIDEKIAIKPHVSLAGNIKQLGLGKLFMVSYQANGENSSRLAILADEGGAFDNNLFQLDMLVDSYRGWQDYHQANKHLPDYASVWLMIRKTKD